MATMVAAKAPAEVPQEAPKKKSKLVPILLLVLVLLAGIGAGGWFYFGHGAADDENEPAPSSKPSVFLPVDQFTVNLQADGGQQFLQTSMTLKVADQDVAEAIKAQMPEVRSRVLLLLSTQKAAEIGTLEGKTRLADQIMKEVEASLPQDKAHSKPKAKKKAAAEDEDGDTKAAKKAKGKAKTKASATKDDAAAPPQRVLAVFFTQFIIQ